MRKLAIALITALALTGMAAAQNAPNLTEASPSDGSTGLALDTDISVKYSDSDGDTGTVRFFDNNDNLLDTQTGISPDTTVSYSPSLEYGENFKWYADASDGDSNTDNSTLEVLNFETRDKLVNLSDIVVEDKYTADAVTAKSLNELFVDATVESGESLEANLKGYNSTEMTKEETFTINDGTNSLTPSSFSENTTTYALELNATDGSVVVNEAYITGTPTDSNPSGVAPGAGGLLTGNFFEGIPVIGQALTAVSNAVNNLVSFLTGAWAA